MIGPRLDLPANGRKRLISALVTGKLTPPYTEGSVAAEVGSSVDAGELTGQLQALAQHGIEGRALAYALELEARAETAAPRPDLVWSGEQVQGLRSRKTTQVVDELVTGATRSIWISSYAYYNGQKTFQKLADRMDSTDSLKVTLLLNIQRKWGDSSPAAKLVDDFASKLWTKDWPGERQPAVFYDPRSLFMDGKKKAVLHAKAIVADSEVALITSANLTEKALGQNIEAGILTRDRTIASSLVRHFEILIEQKLLIPLP